MKNFKGIILSAAVVLGGAGLILGNGLLASSAFAAGSRTEPAIVMPEESPISAASNVGMYGNADGGTYMALRGNRADADNSGLSSKLAEMEIQIVPSIAADIPDGFSFRNPKDGKLSEEDARKIGINAISEAYMLTEKDIEAFNVSVRQGYVTQVSSGEADLLMWHIQLAPIEEYSSPIFRAFFDDPLKEPVNVSAIPISKEGTPSDGEISSEQATEIGISALMGKYAFTQETLSRFTITTKYFEVTPDLRGRHVWWVNLFPANVDEFSEIGCYGSYIDAETGEALQLCSAMDGKG